MRLLICTQKVDKNDSVLGFFHRWLEEFAKHCDSVLVLCLSKGEVALPANVHVYSLGKEKGATRIAVTINFLRNIWARRNEYDTVFVHMNPEYLVVGGALWRLLKKRIGFWYTHRNVDLKLRIAAIFANRIFTAAPESFQLRSTKLEIIGHGIDTKAFTCTSRKEGESLRIISVGRITPIKNCVTLIEAAAILKKKLTVPFSVTFIGAPATVGDEGYFNEMKQLVTTRDVADVVVFAGMIPNNEMSAQYCAADLAINMTPTGGLDKTVIEAMASGCVPIVSNQAWMAHFTVDAPTLVFAERDSEDLAQKIQVLADRSLRQGIANRLQKTALQQFDATRVVQKIFDRMKQ